MRVDVGVVVVGGRGGEEEEDARRKNRGLESELGGPPSGWVP